MPYTRTTWQDAPSTATPINAANLNNIEVGLVAAYNAFPLLCGLVVSGSVLASFDTNTILGGNIPSTYNHLLVVWSGRQDAAANQVAVNMRFNNDTGANYDFQHAIFGTAYAQTATNGATSGGCGATAANSDTAGAQGNGQVWIPAYAQTTFRKGATIQSSGKNNVDGTGQYEPRMGGFEWRSTAAITRIQLFPTSGNWMIGSAFYLYGIT